MLEGFVDTPYPGDPLIPWTILSASMDAVTTSVSVVDGSTFFPTSPLKQFWIFVGGIDGSTGKPTVNPERMKVTAGQGTNTWTVARNLNGNVAKTHASGAAVYAILTAAGLLNSAGAMTTEGDLNTLDSSLNITRIPRSTFITPQQLADELAGYIQTGDQSANRVFAGPASGSAAAPTFRALVSGDIPDLSSLYAAAGGGTPGGSVNSVQFNDSGAFGGFGSWDGADLIIPGRITGGVTDPSGGNDFVNFTGKIMISTTAIGDINTELRPISDQVMIATNAGDNGDYPWLNMASAGVSSGAHFAMHRSRGTLAAPTGVQDGDVLGNIAWSGKCATGPLYGFGSYIFCIVDGVPSGGANVPSKLEFWSGDDATGGTRLTLFADGHSVFTGALTASNLSGTNTGDQSLAAYLTSTAAALAYQPLDGDLTAIAALSTNGFAKRTGTNTWAIDTSTYLTSVTAHNLLSTTHGDTLADTVVRGDILYGNSTPKWARLAKPSVLSNLSHDGTDVSWVTATGTGAPVRATSPVFVTPTLGAAIATSITGATALTLAAGSTAQNVIVQPSTTGIIVLRHGTGSAGTDEIQITPGKAGVVNAAIYSGAESLFLGVASGKAVYLNTTSGGGIAVTSTYLGLAASQYIAFGSGGSGITTADATIIRDGAGVVAQRSGATAQKNRIHNTFTTVDTAGEWWKQDWITTANQFRMGAVKGSSSGTARVATWDYGGVEATPTAAISVPITSGNITFGGGLTIPGGTLITTNTALTDGAAAQAGTLLNAPTAGNPTKWVPINDNGTTRYLPLW